MEALDDLRLNIINHDFMKSIIIIIIAGFLFYMLNKGFLNKKSFIVIIVSISVIDMAIVNFEIIEPHDNSYRGTLTRKQATNASDSGVSITDLLQIDNATSPEALIETLIADATRITHPIPVVDSEHKLIGSVDHQAILKAIEGT